MVVSPYQWYRACADTRSIYFGLEHLEGSSLGQLAPLHFVLSLLPFQLLFGEFLVNWGYFWGCVLIVNRSRAQGAHGVLVPGGFGDRGVQGKILAATYARTNGIPYLGICLGMQLAVVEYARNVGSTCIFSRSISVVLVHILEFCSNRIWLIAILRFSYNFWSCECGCYVLILTLAWFSNRSLAWKMPIAQSSILPHHILVSFSCQRYTSRPWVIDILSWF